MDVDLQLDPHNPPRYCPQCARSGLKSKVKKFRIDTTTTELVIMCKNEKCPWPFSVQSRSEATVIAEDASSVDSSVDFSSTSKPNSRKKRRDVIHVPSTEETSAAPIYKVASKTDRMIAPQPISNNVKTDDHEDQKQIKEILTEAGGDKIESGSDDPISLYEDSVLSKVTAISRSLAEPTKQLPALFDATSSEKMTLYNSPDDARPSCIKPCESTSLTEHPAGYQTTLQKTADTILSKPKEDHGCKDLHDIIPHLSRSEPDTFHTHGQFEDDTIISSTPTYAHSVPNMGSSPAAHSTPKQVSMCSAVSSSSNLGSSSIPSSCNYNLSLSSKRKPSPANPLLNKGSSSLGKAVIVEHKHAELAVDAVKVQHGGLFHNTCRQQVSQCEDEQIVFSSTSRPSKLGSYPTVHSSSSNHSSSMVLLHPPHSISSSVTISDEGNLMPAYPSLNEGSSSLGQAQVVEFEREEIATGAVQLQVAGLVNSTTDKKHQPSTRMLRKRKAKMCESAPELKHRSISDADNIKKQKTIYISEAEVPDLADKGSKYISPSSVHVDDDLAEQRRIQSLIKPPYPRRRRIGAGSPRIQSTSTPKSPQCRKTFIKAKLPASKGRTSTECLLRKSKISATNENAFKTPKISHTFAKDLVLEVTNGLEAQIREGEKVNETDSTSKLGGMKEGDGNIGSEVHVDESQVLMPIKTYRRSERFKQRLQPSPVPKITDYHQITAEETLPCSESVVNLCIGSSPSVGASVFGGEVIDKAVNNIEQEYPELVSGPEHNRAPVAQDDDHIFARKLDLNNNSGGISNFSWMGSTVDEKFLTSYSTYLRKLVNKWTHNENRAMDPRIFALLKEREIHRKIPGKFDKVISFFSEVFVKYIYLKSKLRISNLGRILKILKQTYMLENKLFKKFVLITKVGQPSAQEQELNTACKDNQNPTRQKQIFNAASIPPSKSTPPQAHGLVPDLPNCPNDPVNLSKNSSVPPTLLPIPKKTCATKPGEFEDHVDRDENRVTFGKDQSSLERENRGLKGAVLSEGIMIPSAAISHDRITKDGGNQRSLSLSNTCEEEASKGMKKKRSGIEEIMGKLKKRSTRKNTNTCGKAKADGANLSNLQETCKNKSVDKREPKDGASKNNNRRKSAAPTLFEAGAVEEQKLKPLSTMVDDDKTTMVNDEKTTSQDDSGTDFRICSKPSTDTTICTSDGLHNFPQAYARKKQTEKIKRFMEKQKKKAEEGTKRKYAGFGEKLLPVQKESNKKRKKMEDQDIAKQKPKVSKSELDLIEELLKIADSAVAESKSAEVVDDLATLSTVTTESAPVNNSTLELQELQTNDRTGAMVDDLTSLFEL